MTIFRTTQLAFAITCISKSLAFNYQTSFDRWGTDSRSLLSRRAQSSSAVDETTSATNSVRAVIDEALFLDEAAALLDLDFPLSEEELITKAKEFLSAGQGVERPELLASDFTFMGPVVGGSTGLDRESYLEAVGGFKLTDAFPDLNPRFHHFRVDPLDAGRVWFTSVASGTDNGNGFLGNQPTGKEFRTPPQACSLKFNKEGEVIKYTIGHVMERSLGNTGGLGGIFGPAYAIGKALPFPEARPYRPSKRYRMVQLIGKVSNALQGRKKKHSSSENEDF